MQAVIMAQRNLYWRMKEFMNSDNWVDGDYTVITRFPDNKEMVGHLSKNEIPVLAVQIKSGTDKAHELSAEPNLVVNCIVDIFAENQSQLDGLIGTVKKYFKQGKRLQMFNIGTNKPSTVGDYSGLDSLGYCEVGPTFFDKDDLPTYVEDERFIYHGYCNFSLQLPYIS